MVDITRRDAIKVMTIGALTIAGVGITGLSVFGDPPDSGAGGGGSEGTGSEHESAGGKENHWVGRLWIWYDKGGFWNDAEGKRQPAAQGWEKKSRSFFWDRMQESMEHVADNSKVKVYNDACAGMNGKNSKTIYEDAADIALERARVRSKNNRARIVGVAWTAYVSPDADRWKVNTDYYLGADYMRKYDREHPGANRTAHIRTFENMFRKQAKDTSGVEYGSHGGSGWGDVVYGNKYRVNSEEEFNNNRPVGGLLSTGGWKNPPQGREDDYDNWYEYAWDAWTKDNTGEDYCMIVLAVADGEPPQTGSLKVTKKFNGSATRKFNFTVKYSGTEAPSPATKTFSLANGETWEDKDIQDGVKFTITESEFASYDAQWIDGDGKISTKATYSGEIEGGETIAITCENKSGYLKLERTSLSSG